MDEEKATLQVEEDEEEDLNRIKEKSRMILEKYKKKPLQKQQQDPKLENKGIIRNL